MRRYCAISFILFAVLTLYQPVAHADWFKTYGSPTTVEWAETVQQTSDGGYILAGWISFYDNQYQVWVRRVLLLKTDSAGNSEWIKTFQGGGGNCVQQTSDGGYIVATSLIGDAKLIKTDSSGNLEWEKVYTEGAEALYVQQTADGGYIIVGHIAVPDAMSQLWLAKTDSLGAIQWSHLFGGYEADFGTCVQQTTDGGYVITGETGSYGAGARDVWLVKTDPSGAIEWDKTFGGTGYDGGNSIQQTTDGGYIITGTLPVERQNGFAISAWLIKTDSLGNKEWDKVFGESEGVDSGESVQQTADGGFIIAGYTSSYGAGESDAWLIKTDSLGNTEWDKTFGGDVVDESYSVCQTDDGGYIIAGKSYSIFGPGDGDLAIGKYNPDTPPPTNIDLQSPLSGSNLSSPPTFSWTTEGGGSDMFSVDLSLYSDMRTYWSTFENLLEETTAHSWTPSQQLWNRIPHGKTVYWRVRRLDVFRSPRQDLLSETSWFRKR